MEPDKPNMAKGYIVDKAIEDAAFILRMIKAQLNEEIGRCETSPFAVFWCTCGQGAAPIPESGSSFR